MKTARIPALVLTIFLLGFVLYIAYSAKFLPEKVATHFGASGQPNGWMSRSHYSWFMVALGAGLPLFLVVQVLIIRRMPDKYINLPNKDYWLSPEHKDEYVSFMSGYLFWMACMLIAFFAGLHYFTIQANHLEPVRLEMGKIMLLTIGFVAASIIWCIALFLHFKKTDNNTE